jgi:acetate---CoA ligase (ADP-forming)
VLLGIGADEAAHAGFETLVDRARKLAPDARIEGVLMAPMIEGGVEAILGVKRDPVFGPVVMLGLGGIFVEVLNDVVFRRAPIEEAEALAMVDELKGRKVFDGVRGRPPADVPALARTLAALSRFAAANAASISSIDVNPCMVMSAGQGVVALDALIVPQALPAKE